MALVQYDPDQLDRAASALTRSQTVLVNEARSVNATIGGLTGFNDPGATRFRDEVRQVARTLQLQSEALARHATHLRKLAQEVRNLPKR
ncbi:WXG100 family type VII secretion target [Umezawaea tangerina]|uniref:Type VII secretion system (Wss) protein ESAT-6 n=1 Tax=Umezawaea tangerina TaxID=84725 RepID=A0A2T0T4C1_9PSEU|nr:WXG100 family type VII secretion target [Umezawaea tangerina]PRY40528.1 type VII secretion system (Wss) protein ESAT-6 [Umezawaea tangerina]